MSTIQKFGLKSLCELSVLSTVVWVQGILFFNQCMRAFFGGVLFLGTFALLVGE